MRQCFTTKTITTTMYLCIISSHQVLRCEFSSYNNFLLFKRKLTLCDYDVSSSSHLWSVVVMIFIRIMLNVCFITRHINICLGVCLCLIQSYSRYLYLDSRKMRILIIRITITRHVSITCVCVCFEYIELHTNEKHLSIYFAIIIIKT